MFCRFLSVPLPRFWCVLLCFVCGFTWVMLPCSLFCLCSSFAGFVNCVAHFVVHFVRVHFTLYLWHYRKITYLFCPVLLPPCLFACFFVIFAYECCPMHPVCPLSWSKWSPPLIIIIVVNMTHFKLWSYIKKMSFTTVHISFWLVFDTHHRHIPCCALLHASAHICKQLWPFLPTLPKHDVRGNFPDHRVQIRVSMTIFYSFYSVYVSSHAPCTSKHPYKLIQTQSHVYSPA